MDMLEVQKAVFQAYQQGSDPRELLAELLPSHLSYSGLFSGSNTADLWNFAFRLAAQADQRRQSLAKPRLTELCTIFSLIDNATRIVVLIGAGASVGQDFRSPGGLYDTIRQTGALSNPYDVFDLVQFERDPSIFWRFANLVFPAEIPEFSATHFFLEALEERGKLLRLYSQNVDTLERGISPDHLRCVHGSWRTNSCLRCDQAYSIEDLRPSVNAGSVPCCVRCGGPIKPGIVFFGQQTNLNDQEVANDAAQADLFIVVGTSLKVQPVSDMPNLMRNVPSILINREPIDCKFDAELLGDCADIVESIQAGLGWKARVQSLGEVIKYDTHKFVFPSRSGLGPSVVETGRAKFLVSPARINHRDLE